MEGVRLVRRLRNWWIARNNARFLKEIDRLEWKLADMEDDLRTWGFAKSPSENHRKREAIKRLEQRIEDMKAQVPDADD